MEQDPTYIIWHPSLNNQDEDYSSIVFNITPIATLNLPENSRYFYIQILETLGINVSPKSWNVIAFRSNYYRDLETQYWKDCWPISWRVKIALNGSISNIPESSEEDIETYAYPTDVSWNECDEPQEIGCKIIADFKSPISTKYVHMAISSSEEIQKLAKDISAPPPQLVGVNIGNKFFQLQIFLGIFPESFFANGADYALAIENICNQLGGITSFDERVNEWGEI